MSERLRLGAELGALGADRLVRGLEGALQRSRHRREQPAAPMLPKPRTAELSTEPTGQHAVVVNDAGEPFLRIGHRWYQAGGATTSPVAWPQIHAVRVVWAGDPR